MLAHFLSWSKFLWDSLGFFEKRSSYVHPQLWVWGTFKRSLNWWNRGTLPPEIPLAIATGHGYLLGDLLFNNKFYLTLYSIKLTNIYTSLFIQNYNISLSGRLMSFPLCKIRLPSQLTNRWGHCHQGAWLSQPGNVTHGNIFSFEKRAYLREMLIELVLLLC